MHSTHLGRSRAVTRLCPLALLAVAAFPMEAQILNRNLLLNAGAEDGVAARAVTDPKVASVPNWTTTGGFSVGNYASGDFPSANDYGPPHRGKQLFYGGPGAQRSTATQTVDLSGAATDIDAGRAKYYFSGYLGLVTGTYDTIYQTSLKVEFQDAAGAVLLTAVAAGPTVADVNIPEGLLLRATSGYLPANVRKARVTIDLFTGSSGYNGYAADELSLSLTTDPMFGVNLLVNGNAETDPQSTDGYPVPGWNADTFMAVAKYGDYKMPAKSDPGPSDRGVYFLTCPSNHSQCRAYQTVDFTMAAKLVDAGRITFSLGGWFGGDISYPDNADATVTFYDASNQAIVGTVRVGPITNSDRSGQRGLWSAAAGGTVPAGARSARIDLYFHKLGPVTDNLTAYADSLTFQLDSMQITTVVNAASGQGGAVAPGEFVTIYGSSLGPSTPATAQGLQKVLGGVHVTFNGTEAFLTYASSTQINAIIPYGVAAKADAVVQYNGNSSAPFALALTDAAPGIFTQQYGAGPAWAVNNDANFNGSDHPVARGGWISFWATGQGIVEPAGQDGEAVTVPKSVKGQVKLTIGGADAQVLWTGLIYTGEVQVNAMIPNGIAAGENEIVLTIGSASSRKGVTVSVK
jgi:uncharacterized protein (TIGR03437 family)